MLFAEGDDVTFHDVVWLTLAMTGARTLAMALNRLIDSEIDARNPRTAGRELPTGELGRGQVLGLCAAACALYVVSVFQLDAIVRWLWPIPVAMFVVYPYLKRFTWLCHIWLGACLGLVPPATWLALTGTAPWEAWALGAAVLLWSAGFDMFYALFDLDHDRQAGLSSWAVRFGVNGVFRSARVAHAAALCLLVAVGLGENAGAWYWLGLVVVSGLLLYEHTIIRPNDLARLDLAFMTANGLISIVYLGFVALDVLL
jgi:4-hydroxybenzoate polyprenyltransferase